MAKFGINTAGNVAKTTVRTADKVVYPVAVTLGANEVGRKGSITGKTTGPFAYVGGTAYNAATSSVRDSRGQVKPNR